MPYKYLFSKTTNDLKKNFFLDFKGRIRKKFIAEFQVS